LIPSCPHTGLHHLLQVLPEVIGYRLTGKFPATATATDLVLTVTQALRARGVVDKFVEFFGPGLQELSLADRAVGMRL